MWLRDTGVLIKMKYDVLKQAIPIPFPRVWKDQPLNLYQLEIIMIVFGVGIFSSILAFLYELRKTDIPKQFKFPDSRGKDKIEPKNMEKTVKGGGLRDEGVDRIEVVNVIEIVINKI